MEKHGSSPENPQRIILAAPQYFNLEISCLKQNRLGAILPL
jgi:hypothetical protein